jgi:phage terminase small subunit
MTDIEGEKDLELSAEAANAQKELNPKQWRFVEEYVKHANARQAAIDAGYAPKWAANTGWTLIHVYPQVRAAIELARRNSAGQAAYNYDSAMADADRILTDALACGDGSAAVKAAELKMKLSGLLVDRSRVEIATVDIKAALEEAKRRAFGLTNFIDVRAQVHNESKEVESASVLSPNPSDVE